MKVIPFKINNVSGRAHVEVREQLIPQLVSQGLIKSDTDLIEVDWNGTGRYVVLFAEKQHVLCPFCSQSNSLGTDDLGFEEFECSFCFSMFSIPESLTEIHDHNHKVKYSEVIFSAQPVDFFRVMLRGEDRQESCLKNGIPAEYADLVCAGLQTQYPEGKCWLEPEMTYQDLLQAA